MKYIKIYLGIVTALLIAAIGFGVYIWYTIQNLTTQIPLESEAEKEVLIEEVKMPKDTNVVTPTSPTPETAPVDRTEPIVVEASKLTPAQQEILKTFGYSQNSFTITREMIQCAEDALGAARFAEIIDGSAPSPLESLRLLPCFKK